MIRSISVKIPEAELRQADKSAKIRRLSRNAYIHLAVRLLNREDGTA